MMPKSSEGDNLADPVRKCLGLLARAGHFGLLRDDRLLIVGKIGSVSVRAGSAAAAVAGSLERAGFANWHPAGSTRELRITEAGLTRLGGRLAGEERHDSGVLRSQTAAAQGEEEEAVPAPAVNPLESPLAWLRSRRDKSGRPLIDAAAFEAGERFRRDLAMSGILPRVTADWSTTVRGSGWRGGLLPFEALTAARQRVRRALDAVGPDFAGLLIDLCGFLKGLESIERERQWPPRSAKIAAQMALAALARHYGLSGQAKGLPRALGIRRWQDEARGEAGQATGVESTGVVVQLDEYRPEIV